MASSVLGEVKEEVTCPICLELMTEPVSTDCGHSFCRLCITSNYESSGDEQGVGNCPVCRATYRFENLRPIRTMASIVEKLRGFTPIPMADHCERHGEKLLLFCKEDGKVICWLCERSQEHRGHRTFLMDEVAQEYQEKLRAALEKLRKDEKEFEKWKADIEEERTSWKNQIQWEIESVQAAFEQLRVTLNSEEQKQLQKLKTEQEGILKSLAESENELTQQAHVVSKLVSEVERRLQGSTTEMLQDVKDTMERSKLLTLKKPKTFSKKQRTVFQAPDLRGLLQVHQELMDVRRYWAPVTLAPSNNPNVVISADKRQIRCGRNWRGNDPFQMLGLQGGTLGYPPVTSGKHYWEVVVGTKNSWLLGLIDGRNIKTSFNFGAPSYQPKSGYWVIELKDKFKYNAFEESDCFEPLTVALSLAVPPRRVGVFLDYEARTVSFYNVTNHGFLIYKFSKCSFSGNVFPFFSLWGCPAPMTLCGPNS